MEKKKTKGISLLLTLLLMGFVPVTCAAIIMTIVAGLNIKSEVREETFEKLMVAAESVDQYFAYDVIANGAVDYEEYADHEFIQSAKEQDVELTLFQGDTRFLTSLKNADGSYNEGTQASAEVFAIVSGGKTYESDNVVINGTDYFVFYQPVYDGDGNFWGMAFAGTPSADVSKAVATAVTQLIVIAVIVVLIFAIIIAILAMRIKKSIAAVGASITRLADGDMSERIEMKDAIVEITEMINASNMLTDKMNEVIGTVKDCTGSLAESVEAVQEGAQEASEGTEQISGAMHELATATVSLSDNVQSVNMNAISMGDQIQGITDNVKNLSDASDEIKVSTEKAQGLMTQVLASSEQSNSAVTEISDSIALTNESIEKITEAVNLIAEIASQTNLLSLNASIEAARAGEAGRGFAVVAEEIGKLATESSDSAETIRKLAEDMNDKSKHTVVLAGKIGGIIKEEQSYVQSTQEAFESLGASIEESLAMIAEIDTKTGELTELKEGIINNISDLSAISEENAASNEEVTASVTNIAHRVSEMAVQSDAMKALSDDLQNAVAYFK